MVQWCFCWHMGGANAQWNIFLIIQSSGVLSYLSTYPLERQLLIAQKIIYWSSMQEAPQQACVTSTPHCTTGKFKPPSWCPFLTLKFMMPHESNTYYIPHHPSLSTTPPANFDSWPPTFPQLLCCSHHQSCCTCLSANQIYYMQYPGPMCSTVRMLHFMSREISRQRSWLQLILIQWNINRHGKTSLWRKCNPQ